MISNKEKILDRTAFGEKDIIFKEGQASDFAYLIQSGEVRLLKKVGDDLREMERLGPGAMFGEMALVDGGPRLLTAEAISPVAAIRIPKHTFEERLEKSDPFMRTVLEITLNYIRKNHVLQSHRADSFEDLMVLLSRFSHAVSDYVNSVDPKDYSEDIATDLFELETVVRRLTRRIKEQRN